MSCSQYGGQFVDAWLAGNYVDAFVCPFDAQLGSLTVGAMIFGGVMTALYIRTQSFVLPLVVTVLGGTVAVSRLPAVYMQVLGMGLLFGVTLAAYLLYRRVQTVT